MRNEPSLFEPDYPNRASKAINKIIVTFLLVIALCLAVFLNWSFATDEVLTVKNNPFPARLIHDESGQTGGVAFLLVDYCKNVDVEGKLQVSYVSKSREQFVPMMDEKLPKGCDKREIPIVIPRNLSYDTYVLRFTTKYDINPLKKNIEVNFESQPVTIGGNL